MAHQHILNVGPQALLDEHPLAHATQFGGYLIGSLGVNQHVSSLSQHSLGVPQGTDSWNRATIFAPWWMRLARSAMPTSMREYLVLIVESLALRHFTIKILLITTSTVTIAFT